VRLIAYAWWLKSNNIQLFLETTVLIGHDAAWYFQKPTMLRQLE
jgi:hypothetical protein